MDICYKCQADKNVKNNITLFPCDSCKRLICADCADLSASEIRCMGLKSRKLMFLCSDCEKGILLIPTLLKQVSDMQLEINELKQRNSTTSVPNTLNNEEDLISEMLDRQKRMSNIIVYNVNESHQKSQAERNIEDKEAILNILEGVDVNKNNIKLFRLGKFITGKVRPIKVILNSAEDAKHILKNKQLIKIPSIKIFADQTLVQRQYFRKVKAALQELIDSGDTSKTIRYVNNKPTIVKKATNGTSKN